MRGTTHNGRTGKDGAYSAKHNDRNFDVDHAEHIDKNKIPLYDKIKQAKTLSDELER